jgi:Ca2+-binding EF-hand superfamily protein
LYNGNLTKTFLDRLFQSVQLHNRELDYLGFVDLILALENCNQAVAISWLFRILDIKGDGFLDESTVSYFMKDVCIRMMAEGLDAIPRDDMVVSLHLNRMRYLIW